MLCMYVMLCYYVCQVTAVKKCYGILPFAWFTLHSWLGIVLVWRRFKKVNVLKASFSKTFLQVTDINVLPTIS